MCEFPSSNHVSFDAGEALKYYIMNTLKKPNQVMIRQFFVQVEQLNSYLETLPCLYYSPKANQATKEVLTLDDMELTTHLLRKCPIKWQTQYNLTKNTTPVSIRALLLVLENIENNANLDNKSQNPNKPKGAEGKCKMDLNEYCIPKKARKGLVHLKLPEKQGEKHCVLCKKHGGPFKSHNMCNCHHFNKDGTPIKNRGGKNRTQPNKKGPKGENVVQLMQTKIKEALCKHMHKDRKRCSRELDSDSDSNDST